MLHPLVVIATALIAIGSKVQPVVAFSASCGVRHSKCASLFVSNDLRHTENLDDTARRSILQKASVVAGWFVASLMISETSQAAVGTLPEFSETNAILQGVTVNVADQSQEDSMIKFLTDAFDFKVLRQRKVGSITDTVSVANILPWNESIAAFLTRVFSQWLGFGPEQLSIPADFTIPVSSFSSYGGHAAICIRYDTQSSSVLYRIGDAAPGDNIAYLQGT